MGKQWSELFKRAFSLQFLGVAITVILGIPALYLALHVRVPNVVFEIESIANVFDLHRPLPELTILFKGDNIQNQGKNLQIVTISIRNNGEQNVLQGDYDQLQPFGLKIPNGQIVGTPRVIGNDSDYLVKNLAPRHISDNTVEFNKLIIERDKSVSFELVVLHDQSSALSFEPFGKIAGQDAILLIDRQSANRPGFWHTVIVGGVLPNLVRFIVSVILFVLGLMFLISINELMVKMKWHRNKNRVNKYLAPILTRVDSATHKALLELLTGTGADIAQLKLYADTLRKPDEFAKIASLFEVSNSNKQPKGQDDSTKRPDEKEKIRQHLTWIVSKCLVKKDNVMVMNPTILQTLDSLVAFMTKTPPPKNIKWARLNR